MKNLYCKKPFHQFQKGDLLPPLDKKVTDALLSKGLATHKIPVIKTIEEEVKVYADNARNRSLGRVGQPIKPRKDGDQSSS